MLSYLIFTLTICGIYALLALSLNLIWGGVGLVIDAGVRDPWGDAVQQPYTFHFTVGPPPPTYTPQPTPKPSVYVSFVAREPAALTSAYRRDTTVLLNTMNAPQVELTLSKLETAYVISLLAKNDGNFYANLAQSASATVTRRQSPVEISAGTGAASKLSLWT